MSHTHSHVHAHTCAHSRVCFFFLPQIHTLLNTVAHSRSLHSRSITLTSLRDADRNREREKERYDIPPGDFSLLIPCFYFSALHFSLPLSQTHTHTCSHCLPSSSSSSFSLKNKKYCCTCREAAQLVFSLFFFHPPGSESCQL